MRLWIAGRSAFFVDRVGCGRRSGRLVHETERRCREERSRCDQDVSGCNGETGARGQTAAKPAEADEAEHWKQSIDYGKEVEGYTEYALGFVASQPGVDPAKTVELIDALIEQNPKSKYIDDIATNAYLIALGKAGGAAGKQKQVAGMTKIIKGKPDNTVALQALVERRVQPVRR